MKNSADVNSNSAQGLLYMVKIGLTPTFMKTVGSTLSDQLYTLLSDKLSFPVLGM